VPQGAFYKIWIDQDADGNATTYHYDEYARLRMIVTAFDQSIVLMYNDQGQISKVFDSLGRSVQLSYTPVTTANGPTQYQLTSIDWNYE
jgi:YD repeat-containing protein